MITRRNSIWLVPALLIVTFPLWKIPVGTFLAPRGGYDPEFIRKTEVEHDFSMNKVNILQSKGGRKTGDIRAVEAVTSKNPNEFILRKVDGDIIGTDDKITNVVAQRGLYNTRTRLLELRRKVVVISKEDNFTMKTDLLFYSEDEGTVHCPGKTQFYGDGIVIKGSSFDYDINSGIYKVGGRVFCTITGYNSP